LKVSAKGRTSGIHCAIGVGRRWGRIMDYGPAFELIENASAQGSEEYLTRKISSAVWKRNDPKSLKGLIQRVNSIRRDHVALQHNEG
jgi:hypothetical protein